MSAAADTVPSVYFLSDYGLDDEFVGLVHVVLHRLAPSVPVVDLAHGVPAFDTASGAAMLERCVPFLGAGVVLAVVDPGVGTDRRGVVVGLGPAGPDRPGWLVGPDNGLLVPAARALGGPTGVVVLSPAGGGPAGAGPTFDGRDLFAPAAAHLARGGDPAELGREAATDSLVELDAVAGRFAAGEAGTGGAVSGRAVAVRWVDRFGNVELDLFGGDLDRLGVSVGDSVDVGVVAAGEAAPGVAAAGAVVGRRVVGFGQLGPDEVGILVDSAGRVALVVDRASAAQRLGITRKGAVRLGIH